MKTRRELILEQAMALQAVALGTVTVGTVESIAKTCTRHATALADALGLVDEREQPDAYTVPKAVGDAAYRFWKNTWGHVPREQWEPTLLALYDCLKAQQQEARQ